VLGYRAEHRVERSLFAEEHRPERLHRREVIDPDKRIQLVGFRNRHVQPDTDVRLRQVAPDDTHDRLSVAGVDDLLEGDVAEPTRRLGRVLDEPGPIVFRVAVWLAVGFDQAVVDTTR
jgi:hypothetical protein